MNVAEELSVGGWPPPTVATIIYDPPGSVVIGTVNALEKVPSLAEIAGLILKSIVPFIACHASTTVEPSGK